MEITPEEKAEELKQRLRGLSGAVGAFYTEMALLDQKLKEVCGCTPGNFKSTGHLSLIIAPSYCDYHAPVLIN